MITEVEQILLERPFNLDVISFKPGPTNRDRTKGIGFAHADPRAYQDRLSEVFGIEWDNNDVFYTTNDRVACSVALTIRDTTRTNVGECLLNFSANKANENAFTTAWAQAFKRACSGFGLGKYLYSFKDIWVPMEKGKFTRAAKEKLYGELQDKELRFWTALEEQGADLRDAAMLLVNGHSYNEVYKEITNV